MARPNAKMRISKKNGITFASSVDYVQWTIQELTLAALKDIARLIRKRVGDQIVGLYDASYIKGGVIKDRTGEFKKSYARKAVQYWARRKELDLQIGFQNLKKQPKPLWYGQFQELGDYGHPKKAFLRNAVFSSINDIKSIEAQYLTALNSKNPNVKEVKEGGDD